MIIAEKITAALDEAQARLDGDGVPLPWTATGRHTHHIDGQTSEHVATCNERGDRDLIVSVVNREQAQITHARNVLALIEDLRSPIFAGTVAENAANDLEASLARAWQVTE